ncbi:MAG: hypothetical protein ACTSWA_05290 [Candidatus Thorarchaeota archaeon]
MMNLSKKEKALLEKITTQENQSISIDELTHSELGCLGKLKQRGYVEIVRDYVKKKKLVRIKQ